MKHAHLSYLAILAASLAAGVATPASAHSGHVDVARPALTQAVQRSLDPDARHKLAEPTRLAARRTIKRRARTLLRRRATQRRSRRPFFKPRAGKLSRQPSATQSSYPSPLKPFREDGIKFYHPWGNDID